MSKYGTMCYCGLLFPEYENGATVLLMTVVTVYMKVGKEGAARVSYGLPLHVGAHISISMMRPACISDKMLFRL